MISAISHITFIVQDMERSALFFTKVFDAKEIYSGSGVKYFLINDLWIALNKGESLPERTYNHIAFQIRESEMDTYIARIKAVGAEFRPDRSTRKAGGGCSIYFYDFDNHLFELHTGTLAERLRRYQASET